MVYKHHEEIANLNKLYSPSAPINSESLFCGRTDHLIRIHEAVSERGQHVAIFGERGVGKTSLANIVEKQYKQAITAKTTCNNESSLAGLWKSIFKRIPIGYELKRTIGFCSGEESDHIIEQINTIADYINPEIVMDIDQITAYLDYVRDLGSNVLVIFDEFDQIKDKSILNAFANIIKYLSDNIPNITIMIVGIGSTITDLIGEHQSIERCLRQISLDKMSDVELAEIVTTATSVLNMTIEDDTLLKIIEYSSGFPHYTHLLGKYSTLNAIKSDDRHINKKHFSQAMKDSIDNVNESIRLQYQNAVLSTKESTLFADVLTACAMVETDEHNTFRAVDVETYLKEKMGFDRSIHAFQYHLGRLCLDERSNVLTKITIGKSRTRYKFTNPLFRAFVRLRYHQIQDCMLI